jgi:hypothetical protein
MAQIKLIDCFYIEIQQELNDVVVENFMKFCLDNNIFPLRSGGAIGPKFYCRCHQLSHKKKIIEFFKNIDDVELQEIDT